MAASDKEINVSITAGTIFKALAIIFGAWLVYYLFDLVLTVLVAIVIASAIEPATRGLARWKIPRLPAVLLVYILAFGFVAILIPFFIFPIIADFSQLATSLPLQISNLSIFAHPPAALAFIGTALRQQLANADLLLNLQERFLGFSLGNGVFATLSVLFGSFFKLVLIVVVSFYLAVQSEGIASFLRVVAPIRSEDYIVDLWRRSQKKIGLWMQGQLLLALIMAVLVFLGLTILQIDHALVLAIFAAVCEIIPFFGPVLAAVPAAFLGFTLSPVTGLMVVGLYIIMQQFENHLIYPLVVRKIVGVPPLLVILSLIIGWNLAGFLGIVLAVPVATMLMELVNDWEKFKLPFRQSNNAR